MSIIVTDAGFRKDGPADSAPQALTLDELRSADPARLADGIVLDLESDTDPQELAPYLDRVSLIAIAFPSFADGRGFSLARHLRQSGFSGTLRARGHVIADQYAHARRVGFDEVEISDDLAARQPEAQWLARTGWQEHFYQKRLQATA